MKHAICGSLALIIMFLAFSAGAAYTTSTADMKVALELDFLAPQSYYEFDGTTLSWREAPGGCSHYMRLVVRDAGGTGTIAGCKVAAVISTVKGKVVGTSVTLHETWDRELPHYADNIQLPDDLTSGNVTVKIEPPEGRRLGRHVGDFLTKPEIAVFKNVNFAKVKREVPAEDQTTEPAKVEWPEGRRPYIPPTPYPGSR